MLVNLLTKRMTSNCGCKPEHQYFKAYLCRGFFTVCAPSKHSPRVSKADISNISPSSEWKEGSDLSKGWHSKLHALSTTANLNYQPPPLPNNAAPQFLQKLTNFYQFKTLSLKSFKAVYFYLTEQEYFRISFKLGVIIFWAENDKRYCDMAVFKNLCIMT